MVNLPLNKHLRIPIISQVFALIRKNKMVPTGLEPASKNTGFGFTADESGNPGGNFQSIFANLLHSEYGFSPDDVVKILQAADRVMLSEP